MYLRRSEARSPLREPTSPLIASLVSFPDTRDAVRLSDVLRNKCKGLCGRKQKRGGNNS